MHEFNKGKGKTDRGGGPACIKKRTIIVPDVETVADGFDGEGFPPLPLHRPVVVAWLSVAVPVRDPAADMRLYCWTEDDCPEREMLSVLGGHLRTADRLVTWNGRGFDMPLLSLRAMMHGVDWLFWEESRHRFGNKYRLLYHYDMLEQLGDFGAARSISLNNVSKLLGLPGKDTIHGSDVDGLVKSGRLDRAARYCQEDVMQTFLVYLAYCRSHLHGPGRHLDVAVEAAERMLDRIRAECSYAIF